MKASWKLTAQEKRDAVLKCLQGEKVYKVAESYRIRKQDLYVWKTKAIEDREGKLQEAKEKLE